MTGKPVFSFPDGAFTPVIADYHALYLDGYDQHLPVAARAAPPPPGAQHRRLGAQRPASQARRPRRKAQEGHRRRPRPAPKATVRHSRARTRRAARNRSRRRRPAGRERNQPAANAADSGLLAIIIRLCVVVVEVTVSSRPKRAVGSARSTRQSSIACARSSRMPLPPASVGAGPSDRRPAVVPAVTSRASRPPRIAIRALLRATSKRPRKPRPFAVRALQTKLKSPSRSRHDVSAVTR